MENVAPLVSEFVVVHDGLVDPDGTMAHATTTAERLGIPCKTFLAEHLGEAEPHRILSFEKASHDWVLWIDPDERLLGEIEKIKPMLESNPDLSRVRFLFGESQELKQPRYATYKAILFDRTRCSYIGIPHEKPNHFSGRSTDYPKTVVLEHLDIRRSLVQMLLRSWKWSFVHAEYFWKDDSEIPILNRNPVTEQYLKTLFAQKRKAGWLRLVFAPPAIFLRTLIKDRRSLRVSISRASYVFFLRLQCIRHRFELRGHTSW